MAKTWYNLEQLSPIPKEAAMKNYPFFALLIVAMLVLPFLSCASTTPATTPPPAAKPAAAGPAPVTATEVAAAIARAEEARQKVIDFEGHNYFPSEWEAAEQKYTQAKLTDQKGTEAVRMVVAAYDAATEAFEPIFDMAVPLYAQAREDEIMALRDDLIATGARDLFPDLFLKADQSALSALDQYEAKEYYPARDTAFQTITMYKTLTSAYNAWQVRNEIIARDFDGYDPDNFDRAGEMLSEAMDTYSAGDSAAAQEKADEALNRYNLVLSTGWAAYAELRSSYAGAERQAALDVKANIATRDLFGEADASYKAATDSYGSKNYEEAAKQFIDSETLFITSSISASDKRHNASEMIREANEKIEESGETARQAEIVLEGGSR
jgi:hypothetical protein